MGHSCFCLAGNQPVTKKHSQMWEEQSGEERTVTYGADRRSWRIVFRFTDRAAERRCERSRRGGGKAARGLISTESRASAKWGIRIQQHYWPALTLPIQPQNQLSWAELAGLFSLHHLGSGQTSPECTSMSARTALRPATSPVLRMLSAPPARAKSPFLNVCEGAVSSSNAGLSQCLPTVSNKNNIPHHSVHFAPILYFSMPSLSLMCLCFC